MRTARGASHFLNTSSVHCAVPPHLCPLPRGEGESPPARAEPERVRDISAPEMVHPLPEGEGRGEGEGTARPASGTKLRCSRRPGGPSSPLDVSVPFMQCSCI